MKFNIIFTQFGIELNNPQTREDILNEYVSRMGGIQATLNYFFDHMHFAEDNLKETDFEEMESNNT